jgi:hypothetical protein
MLEKQPARWFLWIAHIEALMLISPLAGRDK